jgi:hypothetical protein
LDTHGFTKDSLFPFAFYTSFVMPRSIACMGKKKLVQTRRM